MAKRLAIHRAVDIEATKVRLSTNPKALDSHQPLDQQARQCRTVKNRLLERWHQGNKKKRRNRQGHPMNILKKSMGKAVEVCMQQQLDLAL